MLLNSYRLPFQGITLLACLIFVTSSAFAQEAIRSSQEEGHSDAWRKKAVEYAHIMSRLKWTPAADGIPMRKGQFEKGVEVTGVPYSSVKAEGRYIGFDIFLKTFLAAVENPDSVVYQENLKGRVANAECYYGTVCSSYTSYGLQTGIWYLSWMHGSAHREGVERVEPQSASHAMIGDVIHRPVSETSKGSHIELVTDITKDKDGTVTHVRVEESAPPTVRNTNYAAADFDKHINTRERTLYRITDLDAWRGENRAESFLFPNYDEDSASPKINRVLLLNRGDWVPYEKGEPVRFNIMDRDSEGGSSLVIKRDNEVVEEVPQPGLGIVERTFSECGDYTAFCMMKDGSQSQACEFSVCDLDLDIPDAGVTLGEPWEIGFRSDNMNVIIVYFRLKLASGSYGQKNVFVTEQDRTAGKITIPASLAELPGEMEVWLIGENKYGRLKEVTEITVKK